jgi:hypothetical protein
MWKELWEKWAEDSCLPFPAVALGDWNFVEDPMDRYSGAIETVPESFKRLKHLFRLLDVQHFQTQENIHVSNTEQISSLELHGSHSRLDRIKVINQHFTRFGGWEVKHCPVKSDHRLVLTQLTSRSDERPGHGRWSMPLYLLKTRKFMNQVHTLASQLLKDLEHLEDPDQDPMNNIQTLWVRFKSDVTTDGKHCSRYITNENTRQVRTWKVQLKIVLQDEDMSPKDRTLAAYLLENNISDHLKEEAEKRGLNRKPVTTLRGKHCVHPPGHAQPKAIIQKTQYMNSKLKTTQLLLSHSMKRDRNEWPRWQGTTTILFKTKTGLMNTGE